MLVIKYNFSIKKKEKYFKIMKISINIPNKISSASTPVQLKKKKQEKIDTTYNFKVSLIMYNTFHYNFQKIRKTITTIAS